MNILASLRAMHIWVNNAIVETLKFSHSRFWNLRKYTVLVKHSYLEYMKELVRDNQFTLIFQENHLRCFELPQAATNYIDRNVTTDYCIAPPPKNSQKPKALRVLANKNAVKKRDKQANLRIKCLLFRYLKEINALENPRLLLITLGQIVKPSDTSGIQHREQILKRIYKPYKAKWEDRLLKVASKALKEFIAANSEDLGGAA